MIDVLQSRRVADPGTTEWYAARSTGIGASEAAAALGQSRWKTPLALYMEKRGAVPPPQDNDDMRIGRAMESVVVSEFIHRNGLQVQYAPCPMMRHPLSPWVLATPDALLEDGSLLECKTTTGLNKLGYEQDADDPLIPVDWACQAQQQMFVTGTAIVRFGVLIDGRKWRQYTVRRNEDVIAGIVDAERELWERIQCGDPPDPDWEHPSTPKLIDLLYRDVNGETVALSSASVVAWEAYEELGKQAKEIERRRSQLRSVVLAEMGEAGGGLLGDGRMVRRTVVHKGEHVVKPSTYVMVRASNVK